MDFKSLMRALSMLLQQQQGGGGENSRRQSSKALQAVVNKQERFEGKNITKYLQAYTCKIKVPGASENEMISNFELAVIREIRERVENLKAILESWDSFEQMLKNEFFEKDADRITKRSFLE